MKSNLLELIADIQESEFNGSIEIFIEDSARKALQFAEEYKDYYMEIKKSMANLKRELVQKEIFDYISKNKKTVKENEDVLNDSLNILKNEGISDLEVLETIIDAQYENNSEYVIENEDIRNEIKERIRKKINETNSFNNGIIFKEFSEIVESVYNEKIQQELSNIDSLPDTIEINNKYCTQIQKIEDSFLDYNESFNLENTIKCLEEFSQYDLLLNKLKENISKISEIQILDEDNFLDYEVFLDGLYSYLKKAPKNSEISQEEKYKEIQIITEALTEEMVNADREFKELLSKKEYIMENGEKKLISSTKTPLLLEIEEKIAENINKNPLRKEVHAIQFRYTDLINKEYSQMQESIDLIKGKMTNPGIYSDVNYVKTVEDFSSKQKKFIEELYITFEQIKKFKESIPEEKLKNLLNTSDLKLLLEFPSEQILNGLDSSKENFKDIKKLNLEQTINFIDTNQNILNDIMSDYSKIIENMGKVLSASNVEIQQEVYKQKYTELIESNNSMANETYKKIYELSHGMLFNQASIKTKTANVTENYSKYINLLEENLSLYDSLGDNQNKLDNIKNKIEELRNPRGVHKKTIETKSIEFDYYGKKETLVFQKENSIKFIGNLNPDNPINLEEIKENPFFKEVFGDNLRLVIGKNDKNYLECTIKNIEKVNGEEFVSTQKILFSEETVSELLHRYPILDLTNTIKNEPENVIKTKDFDISSEQAAIELSTIFKELNMSLPEDKNLKILTESNSSKISLGADEEYLLIKIDYEDNRPQKKYRIDYTDIYNKLENKNDINEIIEAINYNIEQRKQFSQLHESLKEIYKKDTLIDNLDRIINEQSMEDKITIIESIMSSSKEKRNEILKVLDEYKGDNNKSLNDLKSHIDIDLINMEILKSDIINSKIENNLSPEAIKALNILLEEKDEETKYNIKLNIVNIINNGNIYKDEDEYDYKDEINEILKDIIEGKISPESKKIAINEIENESEIVFERMLMYYIDENIVASKSFIEENPVIEELIKLDISTEKLKELDDLMNYRFMKENVISLSLERALSIEAKDDLKEIFKGRDDVTIANLKLDIFNIFNNNKTEFYKLFENMDTSNLNDCIRLIEQKSQQVLEEKLTSYIDKNNFISQKFVDDNPIILTMIKLDAPIERLVELNDFYEKTGNAECVYNICHDARLAEITSVEMFYGPMEVTSPEDVKISKIMNSLLTVDYIELENRIAKEQPDISTETKEEISMEETKEESNELEFPSER